MAGKTLQKDVVARFMTPEQFKEFMETYQSNRLTFRNASRAEALSIKLTEEEKNTLKVYFRDTETAMSVLERELGYTQGMLYQKAARAAVKILFQNKEKIGLDKLLEPKK